MLQRLLAYLAPWRPGGAGWRHYHRLLTIALILVVAAFATGVQVGKNVEHRTMVQLVGTGYQPGPLPPATHAIGGSSGLPATVSLAKYSVRLHNQGSSFSCVGQTLSTDAEMVERERYMRGHPRARAPTTPSFSSGWIWNAFNGGNFYQGINYSDAFGRWQSAGMATLAQFPYDGTSGWTIYPPAIPAAYQYHIAAFYQIAPYDVSTIKQYLAAGLPLGLALPWYYSLANAYGQSFISGQSGQFMYWHSTAVIGYGPQGLLIQNSFGPSWGVGGRATLSWDMVNAYSGAIVVGIPANSLPPVKAVVRAAPFNAQLWDSFRLKHHLRAIPYRGKKHHLYRVPWAWRKYGQKRGWGVPQSRQYNRARRVWVWHFTQGVLYRWGDKRQTLEFMPAPGGFRAHRH